MRTDSRAFIVDIKISSSKSKSASKAIQWLEKTCGLTHKDPQKNTELQYTAIIRLTSDFYSLEKRMEFWISACAWKIWHLNREYLDLHFTFRDTTAEMNQANKINLADLEGVSLGPAKRVWEGSRENYETLLSGESWTAVAAFIAKDMKENANLCTCSLCS